MAADSINRRNHDKFGGRDQVAGIADVCCATKRDSVFGSRLIRPDSKVLNGTRKWLSAVGQRYLSRRRLYANSSA
ncbi:hypothetical protein CEXT_789941 [Caerostris extrusa]|uniref:Uncharacterized protein n=1 Tax=Caerostris extrusa TaxID=172846 RepID=A0AAV4M4W4_CAEEX|nr:hypothetical protein CEXT_789941 [Caerostris extrusa]